MKLEREVMKDAADLLAIAFPGSKIWRCNSGRKGHIKFASINLPDYCGVSKWGSGIYCEVKKDDGRLTAEQFEFLLDMSNRGCWAGVYVKGALHQLKTLPREHMPREKRMK